MSPAMRSATVSILQEIGDRWKEAMAYQHLGRLTFVQEIGRYPSTLEYFKVSPVFICIPGISSGNYSFLKGDHTGIGNQRVANVLWRRAIGNTDCCN